MIFEYPRKAYQGHSIEAPLTHYERAPTQPQGSPQKQSTQRQAPASTPVSGIKGSGSIDTVPPAQGRAARVGGGRQLSGWELDLLVTGYLSAVARELRGSGLIEICMQLGPPSSTGQLSGTLTLLRIGERATVVDADWGTESGWTAQPAAGLGPGPVPRFLHSLAVPDPREVAALVTAFCTGNDVGFIDRPRYPEHHHGHRRGTLGHAQTIASLAWYALPEVRRWVAAPDPLDAECPNRAAQDAPPT